MSRLNRRSLLAAAVAAPLAPVALTKDPRPAGKSVTLYASGLQSPEGHLEADTIHPSSKQAQATLEAVPEFCASPDGWQRGVYPVETWFAGDKFRLLIAERDGEPLHTLHVPPLHEEIEERVSDADITDRESALREASRFNAEAAVAGRRAWAVVVEVGEPVEVTSYALTTAFEGGLGVERRDAFRPLRVVVPTEDEVKRLAEPLEWVEV